MRFYDEVGWHSMEDDTDLYEDTNRFEDLRPVSQNYVHRCHMRVTHHIPPGGQYLLDVASGPVPFPEYVTYSEGYECRICVDISIRALQAAKKKLGNKGIYIKADITQLPLKSESVDAFVSLHTVYHVPKDSQILAFQELERVLKPQRSGVVVYTWGWHCRVMGVLTARHPSQALSLLVGAFLPNSLLVWLKSLGMEDTAKCRQS